MKYDILTMCNDEEEIKLFSMSTQEKVQRAVRLLRALANSPDLFLAYSGGKDSVLIDFLAKEAKLKVQRVHNVTTIDREGVLNMAERAGCILKRPELSFLDLVEKKGFPTMFRRFCCAYLKEQYIGPKVIMGVRKAESVKRMNRYKEVTMCRLYPHKKKSEVIMPLLYWTNEDIKDVTFCHSLEHHPHYYDKQGEFYPNRRIGCIGCPLQWDRGRSEWHEYPILLKQILRRGILYYQRTGRTADDAALQLVYILFYSNHKEKLFYQTYQGLFGNNPWERLLIEFGIDRDDVLSKLPKPKFI